MEKLSCNGVPDHKFVSAIIGYIRGEGLTRTAGRSTGNQDEVVGAQIGEEAITSRRLYGGAPND